MMMRKKEKLENAECSNMKTRLFYQRANCFKCAKGQNVKMSFKACYLNAFYFAFTLCLNFNILENPI